MRSVQKQYYRKCELSSHLSRQGTAVTHQVIENDRPKRGSSFVRMNKSSILSSCHAGTPAVLNLIRCIYTQLAAGNGD